MVGLEREHSWLARFPQILRAERLKAAFTREELADQIGVPIEEVGPWEEGVALPPLPEFFSLAEVFGWPIPRAIVEKKLVGSEGSTPASLKKRPPPRAGRPSPDAARRLGLPPTR
jgi:transcriptional regulator with XRE-family HTH domain